MNSSASRSRALPFSPSSIGRKTAFVTNDKSEIVYRRMGLPDAVAGEFQHQAAVVLRELVAAGAALGWVDPPDSDEVSELMTGIARSASVGDACLVSAWADDRLAGMGYWCRYARPTHRPHADVEKVAVATAFQGLGVGRGLMTELIAGARAAGIEVLTLDFRGDNERAANLYRSLGFREYGRLPQFVAVGERRFDKVLYLRDLRARGRAESAG
jgi:ribosomal protein S18 acetylase RimI-like enzyme